MPKLWKFLNRSEEQAPKVQDYAFTAAEDLELTPDPEPEEPETEQAGTVEEIPEPEPVTAETDPLGYARIQADKIEEDARREAEEILQKARQEAEDLRQQALESGSREGYAEGFAQGRQEGAAKALEETALERDGLQKEYAERVEAFTKSAERALTHQLSENISGMRDLAIAVAEKVVCISLRSSTEVIGKMIQTAVDKRKRREWVHIYIAGCDARNMTSLPPALATALTELSDHVRIIPMADDESGTCIVEFPDEIVDASASTQIQNIRELLNASGNQR